MLSKKNRFMTLLASIALVVLVLIEIGIIFFATTDEINKYKANVPMRVSIQYQSNFKSDLLEGWYKNEATGDLRMVSAHVYERSGDEVVLCDEAGQGWMVEGLPNLEDDDTVMLWIANNGTAKVEDDRVVNVWVEA